MGRVTEAQRIERENDAVALDFFKSRLSLLPDPRRRQGVRYPLQSVVTIALMAMVCGSNDAEAMQVWGRANAAWLSEVLDLPHGPPTQDVFLAVFGAMDSEAFSAVFRAWLDLLRVRQRAAGRHIAVDGKTSRRSFDTAGGRPAIHTVSAWLSQEGLVLGQVKTAEKSNEITAIPELLRGIDLRHATVTIDAMGCQTDIAKTIVEGGGQYILAVKNNQPSLYQDIATTFAKVLDDEPRAADERSRPRVEIYREEGKGHGRLEKRTIALCRDLDGIMSAARWTGLNYIALVVRERTTTATGKTSTEVAYYIGSDASINAERAASAVRRHWSIENGLHWVLDMAFREDEARHRSRNVAQNFTTLRHFALNLLKRDPHRKLGIANSRKRAGWDHDYLLRLLCSGV